MGFVAPFRCGLRIRLMLLVLLVCAPLAALTIHQFSKEQAHQSEMWEEQASRLTRVAATEEAILLRDTRQLLFNISIFSGVALGDIEAVKRYLEDELSPRAQYSNLGILDAQGNLLVSANKIAKTNFSNMPFFKRAMTAQDFSSGKFSSRVVGGKSTIDFGYPIIEDGVPVGVAFASVNLTWLDRSEGPVRSMILFREAVWTELDTQSRIISQHPGAENGVGRPFQPSELAVHALATRKGVVKWTRPNSSRMISSISARHSALIGGPATGILTVPAEVLFEDSNQRLEQNIRWLAATTLLTLLIGWLGSNLLVVQPIKTLARASARLAAGDMGARTGLKHSSDELGQLTTAFDQMAESLEHREQEKVKSAKMLQALSHKLVEVQENERRHIARELHDEIGQSLTAAEMNLQAALQAPDSPSIQRRLTASMRAVEQVLEQVHDLSLNLRPSMLDDLGLEPALRWLTRRQAELAGFEATFHADPVERRLHPMIETECFRIAQEALTNVVRHANARNVIVTLNLNAGRLHLKVRDDGKGFDVAQLRGDAIRGASLGLLSMEERAALAGGAVSLTSAPDCGTEVRAWFPLRWENEQLADEIEEFRGTLKAS